MAITSKGFERAISYDVLGELLTSTGSSYRVFEEDAFKVTAGAGSMQLSIAPGRASGRGIYNVSDETEIRPGTPGSRWDTVALRRDWTTNTTDIVILQGNSTKAIKKDPAAVGVGVLDDQPLALVRWAAGQTAVQEIVDLRVWASTGGAFAADPLALTYLTEIGTTVRIGSSLWVREIQVGVPTWRDLNDASNMISIRRGVSRTIQFLLDLVLDTIQAASSTPKASTLMQYDAAGRAGVNDPTQEGHIANRGWVLRHLSNISDKAATGNTLVMRGDGGQIAVARPQVGGHAANVDWVGDYVTGRITPLAERANAADTRMNSLQAQINALKN